MHDMKKDNSGFSLIELIIVIAIMVVLIGVLTPAIMGYIGKSQRTLDANTADEIKRAVDRILAMDSSTGNSYYDEEAGVWKSVVAVLWNENLILRKSRNILTLFCIVPSTRKKFLFEKYPYTETEESFCICSALILNLSKVGSNMQAEYIS